MSKYLSSSGLHYNMAIHLHIPMWLLRKKRKPTSFAYFANFSSENTNICICFLEVPIFTLYYSIVGHFDKTVLLCNSNDNMNLWNFFSLWARKRSGIYWSSRSPQNMRILAKKFPPSISSNGKHSAYMQLTWWLFRRAERPEYKLQFLPTCLVPSPKASSFFWLSHSFCILFL